MFDLPEGKLDKQTSAKFKIPKAVTSGMKKTNFYMVDPQPFTLTMGWCQLLGVPVVKKSHLTVNADLWCVNSHPTAAPRACQWRLPLQNTDQDRGGSVGCSAQTQNAD